jgi:tight adherence protein B
MYEQYIIIASIFLVGFLLTMAILGPLMSEVSKDRRRLRQRIRTLTEDAEGRRIMLLRERYLRELSPLEKRLSQMPGMDALQLMIDQAGSNHLPHRLVLLSLALAVAGGGLGLVFGLGLIALPLAAVVGSLTLLWLRRKRTRRLDHFEEQLPDALTIASRAMRAGLPFSESLKLVSQEMKDPVALEFGIVYTEISYGGDARSAMLGLLQRVPSVNVMALVTSIMIQRDTGGNLAELLDKLSGLVRQRFRFERTVRTLSAESRLTAMILSMLPFIMVGLISLVNPTFMPVLLADPAGQQLVLIGLGLISVGILWLRHIVDLKA